MAFSCVRAMSMRHGIRGRLSDMQNCCKMCNFIGVDGDGSLWRELLGDHITGQGLCEQFYRVGGDDDE